jgi:hypothetical protein
MTDARGHRETISARGVEQIVIDSHGGADRINYALTGTLTTSETVSLDLGSGGDHVNLNFLKGVSAPRLTVNVTGHHGNDNITAAFGAVHNTDLALHLRMGSFLEPLHANVSLNGDVTGTARVLLDPTGGLGASGINMKVHGNVGARAQLTVEADGGVGPDTIHVDYWGKVDGRLNVLANGGPGQDWVEANLHLTAGSKGSVRARVLGGPGDDLLILRVLDSGSRLRRLDALIDGGAGDNIAIHTPNVRAIHVEA